MLDSKLTLENLKLVSDDAGEKYILKPLGASSVEIKDCEIDIKNGGLLHSSTPQTIDLVNNVVHLVSLTKGLLVADHSCTSTDQIENLLITITQNEFTGI
jgi:hypothetical protein